MSQKIYVQVPLTQGKEALIDLADWPIVRGRKWRVLGKPSVRVAYANAHGKNEHGKDSAVLMHRIILGAQKGETVDHINGNGLDNRRENMRLCSMAQNSKNRLKHRDGVCGFKGVSERCDKKAYMARIFTNGVGLYLGSFPTAEEAARAYDKAARELHGEFARFNFPEDK